MAKTYKTISGDTWDSIAKKAYGDEMAVSFLMSQNQPLLSKYFVFPAGVKVTIEDPPTADDGLPLWRF
jgi:phage tail protein X